MPSTSLTGRSDGMSSFPARKKQAYGNCRLIKRSCSLRSLLLHFHNLIPLPQITRALLIMFPWGEQLLIGNESSEIKEHWLIKKQQQQQQKQLPKTKWEGRGNEGRGRRSLHLQVGNTSAIMKEHRLGQPRDLERPLFFCFSYKHIGSHVTIYTSQCHLTSQEAHHLINQVPWSCKGDPTVRKENSEGGLMWAFLSFFVKDTNV